jgi:DNA/RNA-binding domain of Phe-tRNA-synthetase-like protein
MEAYPDLRIQVAADVEPHCRIGMVVLPSVKADASDKRLREKMRAAAEDIRARHAGESPGRIDRVVAVRAMYRSLHMDPHHTRPSSEALLRRLLRGEPLPEINCIVDAANLWSVTTLCPVGLYDAGTLEGEIRFHLGEEGSGYEGIRKDWVNVSNRPVLEDGLGPFGNPTSDSRRAAVTEQTRSLMAVAFQPPSFPRGEVDLLEAELQETQEPYEGSQTL